MSVSRGFDHPFFAERKHPDVIAHRGGAGQWPGETIYAFEQALTLKVDVIEMDVRYTKDDELVLMHDPNLKKTTGIDKRVKEVEFDEIKDVPATYEWPKDKKFPDDKVNVPALRQILTQFKGVRMNIEIKGMLWPDRLLRKFCNLIRENGVPENVLVASFWPDVLMRVRQMLDGVATSASWEQMTDFRVLNNLLHLKSNRIKTDALQISSRYGPLKFITPKYIRQAHDAGLPVHGWTVNDEDEMRRLIDIGVDGIITDYPSVLLDLLGRNSIVLPSP